MPHDTTTDTTTAELQRLEHLAYEAGYNLAPDDPAANWIDALEGRAHAICVAAYHRGQIDRDDHDMEDDEWGFDYDE